MLDNLNTMISDIKEKANLLEEDATAVRDDLDSISDEDLQQIENMKQQHDSICVVSTSDTMDRVTDTPISTYLSTLDEQHTELMNNIGDIEKIKTVNQGDIKNVLGETKAKARQQTLEAFRSLTISNNQLSDQDILDINDTAIQSLASHFNMTRLDSDILIKKLQKLSLKDICDILSAEFTSLYISEKDIAYNNVVAKNRLLSAIAYLCVTGPEMDYLNEYIENENKLMTVSKQLAQSNVDFTEMLKDPKVLSELVQDSLEIEPEDTSIWSKYIKEPNRLHNEFAQRAVLHDRFADGYREILEQYPDIPENKGARDIIFAEIEDAHNKKEVYKNVCDLSLFRDCWNTTDTAIRSNKKATLKYITSQAIDAVERIRRSKQQVPFPGYDGKTKKADKIFEKMVLGFSGMILQYNNVIQNVLTNSESVIDANITPIEIESYDIGEVNVMFATLVCINMGRILKRLTKNGITKFDAIMLDAYFQLYCKMGTDIYIMSDIWEISKDLVKYCLDRFKR